MPGKTEVDMFKSKAPEKDQSAAANLEEVVARAVQQHHSVVEHPSGRESMTKPGTGSCIGKATGGEIFRMGVWGGKNGTLFPHFPEITKAVEAASDHAAIDAEINLWAKRQDLPTA
jgi:hypothetical protein